MTIHDELVLELIKPDRRRQPTGYITQIVGGRNVNYILEELFYCSEERKTPVSTGFQLVEMTPDIVVTNQSTGKTTAIELESDVDWDFANSLRQIKKYKRNSKDFNNVVVIIPKKYERFAMLYENEGFPVYFWKATRIWECRCGKVMEDERIVKPRCSSCNSTELEFKRVKDVKFEPFEYPAKS